MNYIDFRGFRVSTQKLPGGRECAAKRCIIFCPFFWVLLWTAWRRRWTH